MISLVDPTVKLRRVPQLPQPILALLRSASSTHTRIGWRIPGRGTDSRLPRRLDHSEMASVNVCLPSHGDCLFYFSWPFMSHFWILSFRRADRGRIGDSSRKRNAHGMIEPKPPLRVTVPSISLSYRSVNVGVFRIRSILRIRLFLKSHNPGKTEGFFEESFIRCDRFTPRIRYSWRDWETTPASKGMASSRS